MTDNGSFQARRATRSESQSRRLICGALAIACAALLCNDVQADAPPPALAKFAGHYKYAGTREQGVAVVDKALDEALSDMSMVMRLLVKKGVGQNFAETVLIDLPAPKVGIKIGELEKASVELGKTETVKGADGKSGKVTHAFDGTKLTETLAGEDGAITNVFTLSADGKTLHRSVTVTGSRLKKPIKYTLNYLRK